MSQCDEVVFMDEGRILDQGRHVDLMNRNGRYTTLIHTFLSQKDEHNVEGEEQKALQSVNGG